MTMTEPGSELAVSATGVLVQTPSADEARRAMETYQDISRALLTEQDVQAIQTRAGKREFPKRSAFQKLANAYRVSTRIISRELTHDDEGRLLRCDVIVRATHPDGRYSDGDGACSASEDRFKYNTDKIDHDLPATAVTRAKNRAISDLVAFGAVSAEEAESDPGTAGSGGGGGSGGNSARSDGSSPAWATPVGDIGGVAQSLTNLLQLAGVEKTSGPVSEIGQAIFDDCDQSIPLCVARTINFIADALRESEPNIAEWNGAEEDTTDSEGSDASESESSIVEQHALAKAEADAIATTTTNEQENDA